MRRCACLRVRPGRLHAICVCVVNLLTLGAACPKCRNNYLTNLFDSGCCLMDSTTWANQKSAISFYISKVLENGAGWTFNNRNFYVYIFYKHVLILYYLIALSVIKNQNFCSNINKVIFCPTLALEWNKKTSSDCNARTRDCCNSRVLYDWKQYSGAPILFLLNSIIYYFM